MMPEHPHTHTPTHPHTVKRVILSALTLLLGLFVVEGAVRMLKLAPAVRAIDTSDPQSPHKRSDNPILGYELKANYSNPDASIPRTNAHGQRDVERSLEKSAGVRRVILLGDSVVESLEVEDMEQVMHRRLERLYPENSVEVLNFGMNGYCTLAEIELLRVKGLAFKPDTVILLFVRNDFENFNLAMHAFASRPRRPALVDGLFKRSHLFRSICVRFNMFGFAAEENPLQWNADAIGENNVVTGLAMFKALADKEGFRPAVAIWPEFLEKRIVDGPAVGAGGGRLVVEQLAAFHGIPSFRLSRFFARDHATRGALAGPRDTYTIGDGMHANEEGSRVAALALKEVLDALDDPSRAAPAPRSAEGYALALEKVREMEQELARDKKLRAARIDEVLSEARTMLAEGRLEDAARMYKEAIALDPEYSADAHNELGNVLYTAGRPQEAIPHYREILRLAPRYAEPHYHLGMALDAVGQTREAIEQYQLAVLLRPGMAAAHLNLGNAVLSLGRAPDALVHYRQALQVKPDYAEAHNSAAIALHAMGRIDDAIAQGRQAVLCNPAYAEGHNNLGVMYQESGRLGEAIKHFEEAVRLRPGYNAARESLRKARATMGEGEGSD